MLLGSLYIIQVLAASSTPFPHKHTFLLNCLQTTSHHVALIPDSDLKSGEINFGLGSKFLYRWGTTSHIVHGMVLWVSIICDILNLIHCTKLVFWFIFPEMGTITSS